jgi:transposase
MYKINPERRLQITQYYLTNGTTLQETAKKFKVHYQTVHKWVKLYREKGKDRLLSSYKRPWNRKSKKLEKKIAALKEKNPSLTVRKARDILEKVGISISIKGIWGIWKRYGYAGFKSEKMCNDFTEYIPWSKEARCKYKNAKKQYDKNNLENCAKILNSIPSLPKNELLEKMDDNLLNMRRRVEKASSTFGKITMGKYLKNLKALYKKCKRQKLLYSALRIGILELVTFSWASGSTEQFKKLDELKRILWLDNNNSHKLPFAPYFTLLIAEGIAYSMIQDIRRTSEIAVICNALLYHRKQPPPHFMFELGTLYTYLENFKKAKKWYIKSLKNSSGALSILIKNHLADILAEQGEYRKSLSLLREAKISEWEYIPKKLLVQSLFCLYRGMPHKTIALSSKALSLLREKEVKKGIFSAYSNTASAYLSIGEKTKARTSLKRLIPFLEKNNQENDKRVIEILLTKPRNIEKHLLDNERLLPTVKLALLLKIKNYTKAYTYSEKKYLHPYLLRYIFFFPERIIEALEDKQKTHLPAAILKLPVFNKRTSVYHIKILGKLKVYKNQKYIPLNLGPKDKAFLIQFALRAGEPDKKIALKSLYTNFWQNSKNPPRNLSHLLVRIKKALKIRTHLLRVSYRKDSPFLFNKGIHITTDYGEFKQTIAQAKAFLRAGEWNFAKREYKQAFSLFRGEPFKKMYDNWSDDKRLEVLFSYETELLSFLKELKKRGEKLETEKLLKKAEKLLPYSDEIKNFY